MRTRLALAATAAVSLAGLALVPAPASATDVTFTVSSDLLGISQPGAATLTGSALVSLTGASFTGPLGSTVVQDNRGGLLGWSSKITGSAFTDGTTTIPVGNVSVWIPDAITKTGTVTVATAHLAEATALTLSSSAQTLVIGTLVSGTNTATFNPTVKVAVPSTATAGTYTGTITQTVS